MLAKQTSWCLKRILSLLFVAFLGSQTAQADFIFSSLGPGDSFGGIPGWTVSSADSFSSVKTDHGMRFTPTGDIGTTYQLGSVEFASLLIAGENQISLELREDNAGSPGAVIESLSLTDLSASSPMLNSVNSLSNPTLTAGTDYWLVGTTDGTATFIRWEAGPVAGTRAFRSNNGAWNTGAVTNMGAFRLNTLAAVPEPSFLGVVGLMGVGLSLRRSRIRSLGNH